MNTFILDTVGESVTLNNNDIGSECELNIQPSFSAVFVSDWSYNTGSATEALTDNSRWDVQVALNWSDVTSSVGLDFPTENVLQVAGEDGVNSAEILSHTSLPVPAVSESLFYRWYFRSVAPSGSQTGTHPIQDGASAGTSNWLFRVQNGGATEYQVSFEFDNVSQPAGFGWVGRNINYSKSETYRWEVHLYRDSTTTFQMHVRVYNSSGSQIYGDSDFYGENNISNGTLADEPSLNFNDVNYLAGIRSGVNGFTGISGYQVHSYQGGFVVSTTDWVGPYVSSNESDWGR